MYKKKKAYVKKGGKVNPSVKKEIKKDIKQALKKELEIKQYAAGLTATAVYSGTGAGGVNSQMCSVAQGLLSTNRIGDRISVKSLHVRLNMYLGAANSGTSNVWANIRCMVIQYKANDNSPIIGDLLLTSVANATNVVGSMSARNKPYLDDYVVLYDRVYSLHNGLSTANNVGADPRGQLYHQFNVPLKYAKKTIDYTNAAGTSCNNPLWIFFTSDQPTAVTNPTVSFDYDLQYTDA